MNKINASRVIRDLIINLDEEQGIALLEKLVSLNIAEVSVNAETFAEFVDKVYNETDVCGEVAGVVEVHNNMYLQMREGRFVEWVEIPANLHEEVRKHA